MEEHYGYLEIRLNELLKKKGLSKNKLSHKAEMNWKQIDNYCTNSITRLDVYVLCKLCTVLDTRFAGIPSTGGGIARSLLKIFVRWLNL